jgi:uncharacterized protein
MSLIQQIQKDMIAAKMRGAKGRGLLLSTVYGEASAIGKNNGNRETTDEEVIKLITKFVKNNNETIGLLEKAGKDTELLKIENFILTDYLPKQLSEAELVAAIAAIITDTGASSPKQMGLVMKELKVQHGGMYDGKLASQIVREELK